MGVPATTAHNAVARRLPPALLSRGAVSSSSSAPNIMSGATGAAHHHHHPSGPSSSSSSGSHSGHELPTIADFSLLTIVSFAADCVMVVGTSPGWAAQLRQIITRGTAAGFSWFTTVMLLCCYILRTGYYFGQHYHIALLMQCFVMMSVVVCLLAAIADAPSGDAARPIWEFDDEEENSNEDTSAVNSSSSSSATNRKAPVIVEMEKSQRRNDSSSQQQQQQHHSLHQHQKSGRSRDPVLIASQNSSPLALFTQVRQCFYRRWAGGRVVFGFIPIQGHSSRFIYTLFFAALGTVCYFSWKLLPGNRYLTELVGFAALGTEALMTVPQAYVMERDKNTEGFSRVLLFWWLLGDTAKVFYFFFKAQPLPFVVCACVQLSIDFYIVGQIARFRNRHLDDSTSSSSTSSSPISPPPSSAPSAAVEMQLKKKVGK